ncbi:alpha/beta fold hydrolase [Candidatus Woesearchaeota archaeon]|nr:alpha/beta fold hydrolase [Candidatus Woesearchaeota archaeon]
MIGKIAVFLCLYILVRGAHLFYVYRKGKRNHKIMKGAEPFFYKKGKKGALLIHGSTCSPSDLRDLGKYLADRDITVSAPLIKGHGTSPYCLAVTSWKDWVRSMEEALEELKKEVDKVYIAGTSIGGNIALCLAAKHDVDGLISLGTPIYFRRKNFYKRLAFFVGLFKSFQRKWYKRIIDNEIQEKRVGYDVIPVKIVNEGLSLVEESRRLLPKITAPSLIMHSTKDFGVKESTVSYLLKNIGSKKKKVIWVKDAYHVFIIDKNKEESFREIYSFIKEN